jgi:hypothetical protein
VLLDAAAQRVDAFTHFLGVVVVGQEVAASLAGGGGARGDSRGVAWVGGELRFERVEEVLVESILALTFFNAGVDGMTLTRSLPSGLRTTRPTYASRASCLSTIARPLHSESTPSRPPSSTSSM